mgnify:CR=1 FL=1
MTTRAAVIGSPVSHSLSPAIHSVSFAALGVDWSYEAVDVTPGSLASFMGSVREGGFGGLSVTMPLKNAVVAHMDSLDDDARTLDAVNCVSVVGRTLRGHNTDGGGCCDALESVAGVRRVSGRNQRKAFNGFEEIRVSGEPAGGQDDGIGGYACFRSAAQHGGRGHLRLAIYGGRASFQVNQRGIGPHLQTARADLLIDESTEDLQQRQTAVGAVVTARHAVGRVPIDDSGSLWCEAEPVVIKPVDGLGRVFHGNAHDVVAVGATGDGVNVIEMPLHAVVDPGYLLATSTRCRKVTAGGVKTASDADILFDQQSAKTQRGCLNSARQTGIAGANDQHIPVVQR